MTPPTSGLVDPASDVPEIRSRRSGEPAYETALATAQQGPPQTGEDDDLNDWQRAIAPLSYAAWGPAQQEHARGGRWSVAAVRAYDDAGAPGSFAEDLAAVQAPVRVVAAAEDGIVGLAGPLALAERFVDGGAATVRGAGHYPWIDRPEEFRAAVRAAIED